MINLSKKQKRTFTVFILALLIAMLVAPAAPCQYAQGCT